MTTAIQDFHDVIVAASTVVADRVSPLKAYQGEPFPYVLLNEVANQPLSSFSGYAGMDHVQVQVDAWDRTFAGADAAARAARTALEAAGYVCVSKVTDQSDAQIDPNAFRVGFVFDVWQQG